jgi:hypothetical protein
MRSKIRTSTAIMGGLFIFLVILILSLILSIRIMAGQAESRGNLSRSSLNDSSSQTLQEHNQTIPLSSTIDSLTLSGVWECSIRKGNTAAATLSLPDSYNPDRIRWEEKDDTLILENDWNSENYKETPQLILTIPEVHKITSSSVCSIGFTGFKGNELTIICSGVADIEGKNSSFDKAVITLSGTGSIDLSDVKTIDADVFLSGLGSVTLNMNGGELKGNLSGLGSIEYYGQISHNSIKTTGLGSISRAD